MKSMLKSIGLACALASLSLNACASPPHQPHHRSQSASIKFVASLPIGHTVVRFGNVRYYTYAGVYYRPYQGRYRIVAAPIGLNVAVLPAKHKAVRIKKQRYFIANGVYYQKAGKKFIVVRRPT